MSTSGSTSSARPRRWIAPALAVLLLLAHFLIGLLGKRTWSATSDELAHLVAGHAYWEFNDYRLQPENGNLPQRWAALPAWWRGERLPPKDDPAWLVSDVWVLGHVYLYQLGNRMERLLFEGRAMALLWSVGLGLLIYLWSRRWFGDAGGLISLTFYALDPGFLAHGALVTSDVCMSFFMLAAVGAWWRHLQDPGWRTGLLSAGVFGLACVAKFSAVLLIPMFLLLAAVRWCQRPWAGPRGALLLSMAAHAVAALIIIWASFGFRYTATGSDLPAQVHFIRPWDQLLAEIGWQGRVLAWLREWRALPEAFLFGYNHVVAYAQQRAAFLDGEYSIRGWTRFFPLAFLYKTTLPLLLGVAVACVLGLLHWRREPGRCRADLVRAAPLLVLFITYWAFSLTSNLNIGHRHILPTYPVLFILLGLLGAAGAGRRVRGILAAGLLTGAAVEAARIHPHELAYFNALAGGPQNGWRRLVDSSLDWGQDLPGLKKWIEQNAPNDPVYLSYFGSGEPAHYGIRATRLPFLNGFNQDHPWYRPGPGWYAISATMLQCVYLPDQGTWTMESELEFQQLRALEPAFESYARDPARRAELDREAHPEQWRRAWKRYDVLRLVRLCHTLRVKPPDAMVGYSILLYRLDAEDIRQALLGSIHDWRRLIERNLADRSPAK